MRWLPLLLVLALQIYALIDCLQTSGEDAKHLPKFAWLILIVIVPLVGAVAWLTLGRPRRAERSGAGDGGRAQVQGPIGPDDDPDFLRQLRQADAEQERMLRQWEEDLRRQEEDGRGEDDQKRPGEDKDHPA